MVIPEEKLSEMYTILKSIPHRQVEEMQRQVQVILYDMSQQNSTKNYAVGCSLRTQIDILIIGFIALVCHVSD